MVDSQIPEDDVEMGFFEHLAELRKRLLWSVVGVIPPVAVAFVYRNELRAAFEAPLQVARAQRGLEAKPLAYFEVMEPFIVSLKVALTVGVLVAAPWIFAQLWLFVAPGLYRKEKKIALPAMVFAGLFFAGGAFFGYYFVFPYVFEFFLDFNEGLDDTLRLGDYFSFVIRMLFAFGLVFEVPVISTLLAMLGVVTWKQLLSFGRWWILIASILSAFLTPPDPASQILMLIPLVVLYFLSVLLAFLFGPKKSSSG